MYYKKFKILRNEVISTYRSEGDTSYQENSYHTGNYNVAGSSSHRIYRESGWE